MRFFYVTLILLLILELPARSQNFEWLAGFDGFLDNREYFSIENPQTIFGSRIKGEIGGSIAGVHRFRAGMNFLHEFGNDPDAHLPDLTIYYQYDNERINFQIGSFPRFNKIDYPLALLSDTLLYYRPNIEGAFLGFRGEWGYQKIFIDWTSRQTDDNYERFIFGFSGNLRKGMLFLNHHLMMGHFAGKAIPDPEHHLRDNGGFQMNLGTDLSERVFMDSLHFSVGALVSLDRIRGVDDGWQTPAGFVGQFAAFYRWVGINGLYYRGEGHTFLYGDPFYKLEQYGRLDLFYMPFHNENVSLKINFVLHFAESQVDYSQQILVSMALH
ncbi:MAG: hypothetical protein ABFS38_10505 [Bacteroidota bacterium]